MMEENKSQDDDGHTVASLNGKCPKGGEHEWRTDGMHLNVFCGKCFVSIETALQEQKKPAKKP